MCSSEGELDTAMDFHLYHDQANFPEIIEPSQGNHGDLKLKELTKKDQRKIKRNSGTQYLSDHTSKTVPARELGLSCNCKKKCRKLIAGKESEIFNAFWDLSDYNAQNAYLFECIKCIPVRRTYPKRRKQKDTSRREHSYTYNVKVNGKEVEVCKHEFLSIHGLQNSRGRIQHIQKMKSSKNSNELKLDQRGRHSNRPNKYSETSVHSAREHINMFLIPRSHSSASQEPRSCYLNPNASLNVESMYRKHYVPWCSKKGIQPVSADKYKRIYCTESNAVYHGLNKSDSCTESSSNFEQSLEYEQIPESLESNDECNELNIVFKGSQICDDQIAQELDTGCDYS